MGWYDWFAPFYDLSVEGLYLEHRQVAAEALALRPGASVLDLPCGTGQSLDVLADAVGTEGRYVGVDLSRGMLARARRRASDHGNVRLVAADARTVAPADLGGPVDALHIFLGLSAFPDWEQAFENLFGLLVPGGRCVVVDVYAERPGLQGRMVELTARADLTRRTWEPLQARCRGFERRDLSSQRAHGGALFLATGTAP